MKITIDTKEDSHEEIRRVIKMLSSLVGEKEFMSNQDIFSDDASKQSNGAFNIFNSPDSDEKYKINQQEKKEQPESLGLDIPDLEEYDD